MDYPKFIVSNQKEESIVYKGLIKAKLKSKTIIQTVFKIRENERQFVDNMATGNTNNH